MTHNYGKDYLAAVGAKEPNLKPSERKTYGATATLIRLDENEQPVDALTVEFTQMSVIDAARAIAAKCDELDGDWRVRTISTPITIHRDVIGRRRPVDVRSGRERDLTPDVGERWLMGRIDRLDLIPLHTKDERRTEGNRRRWREGTDRAA